MLMNVFEGILIPFVGTTLGAACVFFMRKTLGKLLQRALAGFAAGIMWGSPGRLRGWAPRFHPRPSGPPTRPLRPMNPDNARPLRITAAAGT